MAKLDPRKLMGRAIEVMRQSVAEQRTNGKVSPLVGVVLWKPDGTVETACRGELRDGDHAEYTALKRKNRDKRLDGAALFATLERCAPGSRRHPKLGCAERIVLARIKKVWSGIEDPDPMVDRKGIKYLQDSGVTVHMFDRDLQEEVQKANEAFIEQALERAGAAREEKKPKSITLSSLEDAFATAETKDFSTEAMKQYRTIAKISATVGSPAFNSRFMSRRRWHCQSPPSIAPFRDSVGAIPFGARIRLGKTSREASPASGLFRLIPGLFATRPPDRLLAASARAPPWTIREDLAGLKSLGLVRSSGWGRGARWELAGQ